MADHDQSETAVPQGTDQAEYFLGFSDTKSCGRFIHQHDCATPTGRSGNGDGLALATREIGNRGTYGREVHAEFGDVLHGTAAIPRTTQQPKNNRARSKKKANGKRSFKADTPGEVVVHLYGQELLGIKVTGEDALAVIAMLQR